MRTVVRFLAALLLPAAAIAAPDLSAPRDVGGRRVYPDSAKPGLYYLAPGDLEVATDENGRPKLHFLQMRYTGTALYGNPGESGSHSTLTIGMRLHVPSDAELLVLRKAVQTFAGRTIELRPLPITSIEAVVAYAPIGGASPREAQKGFFESEEKAAAKSDNRSFWRERTFTIPMNAATSELLWELLHRQEVALSIGYAFVTRGVYPKEWARLDLSGVEKEIEEGIRDRLAQSGVPLAADEAPTGLTGRLLELVREQVDGKPGTQPAEGEGPPLRKTVVRSGAAAIRVDAARWPDLFQRVDFNEQAPPGYAVLRLYCYDFRDGLRPELLFKKVDVRATAVGGRTVELSAKFLRSQPDLYARSVRFEVPVLLDRPYRYRVTTARPDGALDEGRWIERESWTQILDVTSRPDEVTAAPPPTNDGEPE